MMEILCESLGFHACVETLLTSDYTLPAVRQEYSNMRKTPGPGPGTQNIFLLAPGPQSNSHRAPDIQPKSPDIIATGLQPKATRPQSFSSQTQSCSPRAHS